MSPLKLVQSMGPRAARERLREIAQSVSVVHDLNNLLSSILIETEMLLDGPPVEPLHHKGLMRIKSIAIRATVLARELMDYSGDDEPELTAVDLSALVDETYQLLTDSLSSGAAVQLDLTPGLPAVHGNAGQVSRVIMNLLTNASDALRGEAGVITVSTTFVPSGRPLLLGDQTALAQTDCVCLTVTDSGCGMTSEIKARMFDPFFTTKEDGRGLGLASVHEIVKRHKGVINVVSAPGRGTSVELVLPCARQPASHAPESAKAPLTASPKAARTVLVVEDEETVRLVVSKMLHKHGFTVIEAADGASALNLFRTNGNVIDVVLLDMNLPDISTPHLLAELRAIRSGTKIVLTTAYSQNAVSKMLGSEACWAFLRKPFQLRELIALMEEACRPKYMTGRAAV